MIAKVRIGSLEIRNGSLNLDLPDGRGTVEMLQVNGQFDNIGHQRECRYDLKGVFKLPQQPVESSVRLLGTAVPSTEVLTGFLEQLNLDATIKALDTGSLFNSLLAGYVPGASIMGVADLELHLEKQTDQSLHARLQLDSTGVEIVQGPKDSPPFSVKTLAAAGVLKVKEKRHTIEDLSLQVDGARLAGQLAWETANDAKTARINLVSSSVPIARLKEWLPALPATFQRIRQQLGSQGHIDIASAALSYSRAAATEEKGLWSIERVQGEVRHAAWQPEKGPGVIIASMPVILTDQLFEVTNGRGQLGPAEISYNTSILWDPADEPRITAGFKTALSLAELPRDWQMPRKDMTISGQIPLTGKLEGSFSRLTVDLSADLANLALEHAPHFARKSQAGDTLALHGTLTPATFNLDHGSLLWAGFQGRMSGSYAWEDPDSLTLDGQVTIDNLAELAESFPALRNFNIKGKAELSLKQRGRLDGSRPEAILTLRDAGMTATRHIADLNQINGRVQLTENGLHADNLRVHLGQSPLNVKARLANFDAPRLSLDVIGPAVHASDLVFPSDKAMLRNIVGHLEIDGDGLSFAPVQVRLDGGTQATVRGTIAFRAPGDVNLEITSDFVRISEIIGLWSDRPDKAEEQEEDTDKNRDEPRTKIRIEAKAASGDLYGMRFHNAAGTILPNRDRLTIHPLSFSVGEGYCNAQVLVENAQKGPSLLRVSGHAEGVDALEVYRELLNQKNIVRGSLRGDFYVQGEIGATFLPTSYGDFSIEIHKGVLHQFPVLSKVFSLLNVSQLFALELPDMDTEGMPFSKLAGNLNLDTGVLSSEDLIIRSEAMNQSYRGKLNLLSHEIDLAVAIHPLGTVDKVVSRIPVAGWLLTGEKEAVLTAHFTVTGKTDDAEVKVQPLDTLTETTIGLLRRTLGLPFKLAEDPQILWGGSGKKE